MTRMVAAILAVDIMVRSGHKAATRIVADENCQDLLAIEGVVKIWAVAIFDSGGPKVCLGDGLVVAGDVSKSGEEGEGLWARKD